MDKRLFFKRVKQAAIIFGLIGLGFTLRHGDDRRAITLQREELNLLWEYYRNTEALLDSVYTQKEDWYLDVLAEQDVLYYYELANSKVKKLYQ